VQKLAAALVALLVVGAMVSYASVRGGGEHAAPPTIVPPPTTTTTSPRLLVGFLDDANFRWRADRAQMLDSARGAGAGLVRAIVNWYLVAPERPKPGGLPFIEPRLYELDELVANATARHMQVLFTIWGTPSWANGGLGPNHAPTDPNDLRVFARALAARYPQVRRYAIWNEPNTEQFLAPQFDAAGRSLAPRVYARLYRAAYTGIEEANPHALVAIGETSSHGRDVPSKGRVQDSHSPARFALLLAEQRPRLRFVAWGQHPYPIGEDTPPDAPSRWPAVTITSLERFGHALDRWFERKDVPIWVTEYAYEAKPDDPKGLSPSVQARYAARALALAARVPRVKLFVWFTFRDDRTNAWQSGLLDARGHARPAYERFAAEVRAIDG
jgi:polysaccharide biosynthesis protein PslG